MEKVEKTTKKRVGNNLLRRLFPYFMVSIFEKYQYNEHDIKTFFLENKHLILEGLNVFNKETIEKRLAEEKRTISQRTLEAKIDLILSSDDIFEENNDINKKCLDEKARHKRKCEKKPIEGDHREHLISMIKEVLKKEGSLTQSTLVKKSKEYCQQNHIGRQRFIRFLDEEYNAPKIPNTHSPKLIFQPDTIDTINQGMESQTMERTS